MISVLSYAMVVIANRSSTPRLPPPGGAWSASRPNSHSKGGPDSARVAAFPPTAGNDSYSRKGRLKRSDVLCLCSIYTLAKKSNFELQLKFGLRFDFRMTGKRSALKV